jgi:hypothetical protein
MTVVRGTIKLLVEDLLSAEPLRLLLAPLAVCEDDLRSKFPGHKVREDEFVASEPIIAAG